MLAIPQRQCEGQQPRCRSMHEREIPMELVAIPSVLSTVGPGRMRMSGSKEHWGTHPAVPAPPMHLCKGTCANRYASNITSGGIGHADSTPIWHFVLKGMHTPP